MIRALSLLGLFLHVQISATQYPAASPYLQVYPPVDISQDQESCVPDSSLNRTCPLYIAFISSFGGGFVSSGVIPGVQVALDQINADPNMLPGYTLHYTLQDSQCDRTIALDVFHSEIKERPTKIGMIGSGCSVATEPTAEVSHYYNITQLSCGSSSTELANHRRFPYYFQLLTTEADLAYGFFGIVKNFGWSRVSIILQDENLFTVTMALARDLFLAEGIDYRETRFRSAEGIESLGERLFDSQSRIFILAMYSTHARRVLCEAHKAGLSYPSHLLIVYGWYSDKWWVGDEETQRQLLEEYDCTVEDRENVLALVLAPESDEFLSNYSAVLENGLIASEFISLYEAGVSASELNITSISYGGHCYDAAWSLAYALNKTIGDMEGNSSVQQQLMSYNTDLNLTDGVQFGLQHFTYNNSGLLDLVFKHLEDTNFAGVTVPTNPSLKVGAVEDNTTTSYGMVTFNKFDGVRRVTSITVSQFRLIGNDSSVGGRLKRVLIGHVNHADKENIMFNYIEGMDETHLWIEGRPYDGVPNEIDVTVHLAVTLVFCILALFGVMFTIVCLVFNVCFRTRRIIKLSSPHLNILILIGALILYVNIFFVVIPITNPFLILLCCNLTPWLTALGYSFCYGTILVKMLRIYYIFNNPTQQKKTKLKDWMLALGVLLLLSIDFIILVTFTAVEGARGNLFTTRVENKENPEDLEGRFQIITLYFTYVCASKSRQIYLGVLYGYKAVLQVIAILIAFSIRKVKVKGLDDAKYIAASIYVTSIVTVVILLSTYTLAPYINGFAILLGLGLFIGTTFILLLVFVPKMVLLYHDPEGLQVFGKPPTNSAQKYENSSNITSDSVLQTSSSTVVLDRIDTPEFDTSASSEIPEVEVLRNKVKELETEKIQGFNTCSCGNPVRRFININTSSSTPNISPSHEASTTALLDDETAPPDSTSAVVVVNEQV